MATEPPEPRHPEEGGGEQPPKYDPDEIGPDEFFGTDWSQLERDDELIDLLHAGDVEINDEAVPGEQDAADVLGGERDRVDRKPLPESTHPDAVLAEFERRKKAAEPSAPRTPTQEGPINPMSLQDSIATLLGIAGDTSAAGALQAASEGLNTGLAAAQSAVERLAELAGQARTAAEGNDGAAGEVGSTGEHAAGAIEDLIDAINQAVQAATQATEHEQTFRGTCGDVGNRLAGS